VKSKDNFNELSKRHDDDLKKELTATRDAYMKLRFQKITDEMQDKSVIKKTRLKLARILTLLGQREKARQQSGNK
jgi:ribosomal protein L29